MWKETSAKLAAATDSPPALGKPPTQLASSVLREIEEQKEIETLRAWSGAKNPSSSSRGDSSTVTWVDRMNDERSRVAANRDTLKGTTACSQTPGALTLKDGKAG